MLAGAPGLGHLVTVAAPALLRASHGQGLPFPPPSLSPRGLPGWGHPSLFMPPQKPPAFLSRSGSGEGGQELLLPDQRDPWSSGRAMGWDGLGCAARCLP